MPYWTITEHANLLGFDDVTLSVPKSAMIVTSGSPNVILVAASHDIVLDIAGTIVAESGTALNIGDVPGALVHVAHAARIVAQSGLACDLSGDDIAFANGGLVRSGGATAVTLDGDGSQFANSGKLVNTAADGFAIFANGLHDRVDNSGAIRGTGFGAYMASDGGYLHNSGVIRGDDNFAAVSAGMNGHVENDGRIVGAGGLSLQHGTVVNYGLIRSTGAMAIVGGDASNETVVNHGRIAGKVALGSGDDFMENRGKMKGVVDMGAGNDVYLGGGHDERVHGGADDDRLSGAGGGDRLNGEDGDDRLNGGKGDDRLTGGAGADSFAFTGKHTGNDTVMDWAPGDQLDLTAYALSASELTHLLNHAQHHSGGELVIDLSDIHGVKDGMITFHGWNTELTNADIL